MNWSLPKNKIDIIELLLCIVAFTFPLQIKLIAPLLILLCLICMYDIFTHQEKIDILDIKKLIWTFVPFCLFNILGLFYSSNTELMFFDIQVKLSLLLLPILFLSPSMDKIELSKVLRALLLGCIISFFIAIFVALFKYFSDGKLSHFTYSGLAFFHPTYISMYCCLALVITLFKRDIFTRKYFYSILAILLLYIVLLNSKAGIICSFALLLLYIVWQLVMGIDKKKSLLHGAITLFMLLFIFFNLRNLNDRIDNAIQITMNQKIDSLHNESTNDRLLIWKDALPLCQKYFLMGVGSGDTEEILIQEYNRKNHTAIASKNLNAHNQYIQSMLSGGILLLILLIMPIIYFIQYYYKNQIPIPFFFIFIIAFNMLFESVLQVQAGTIFIGFFTALFWRKYILISE